MAGPVASVVIPCGPDCPWLEEAVGSLAGQDGVLEVILVDGGMKQPLPSYGDRPSLHVVRGASANVSELRNCGISSARAPWIQFLDADDLLLSGKIARQLHHAVVTGADVIYGTFQELCETRTRRYERGRILRPRLDGDVACNVLAHDGFCQIGAMLFRREALLRVGGFDTEMSCIVDVNLYLRLAFSGARFEGDGTEEPSSLYRRHRTFTSLSLRSPAAFHAGCLRNVTLAHTRWEAAAEGLAGRRRETLMAVYRYLARFYYAVDQATYRNLVARLERLDPGYKPERPIGLRLLSRTVGYQMAERLIGRWQRVMRALRFWRGAASGCA